MSALELLESHRDGVNKFEALRIKRLSTGFSSSLSRENTFLMTPSLCSITASDGLDMTDPQKEYNLPYFAISKILTVSRDTFTALFRTIIKYLGTP